MNGHFLLRDGNWQVQKKAKTTAKNSILKILMKKNITTEYSTKNVGWIAATLRRN